MDAEGGLPPTSGSALVTVQSTALQPPPHPTPGPGAAPLCYRTRHHGLWGTTSERPGLALLCQPRLEDAWAQG